jgi:hypothetical protein
VTVIVSASSAFKDSPTIFEPVENNLPFLGHGHQTVS